MEDVKKEQSYSPAENQGVKVYPPSYLPAKASLHTTRPAQVALKGIHIELIHIGLFIVILLFLFLGIWKRPNLR